jgi:pyocin large subunit-like protein
MAELSTLAAASGAVQGLQQGTQNAEDTKRFLASLLQQQRQFDVTSGLESRRVGALEQQTGATVRQMGAETDIKKVTLRDMKLEARKKELYFNTFVDENIPVKEARQMASDLTARDLANKQDALTTRAANEFIAQDPELARDIGLAGPRQEYDCAT